VFLIKKILDKKTISVIKYSDQTIIATRCKVANSFFSRLQGLIGKKILQTGEGLWITRCKEIHMWWMKIPIDVIFLKKYRKLQHDRKYYEITSFHKNLKPWHLLPVRDSHASDTLELPVGSVERFELQKGTLLELQERVAP